MPAEAAKQGFAHDARERLPMLEASAMDDAQRAAARALVEGPRKGVYGPFLALLRTPKLLERIAGVGESLRFDGSLDARLRELAICAVALHTANQFEWVMHAPLAIKAGAAKETIDAIRAGARPKSLPPDEEAVLDFTRELLATHGASDAAYAAVLERLGEPGVVELTSLVGYFVMVCWVMNVARTPSLAAEVPGLDAFPQ
jgi:4-carboxymuconolactone decarboxylase